MIDCTKNEFIPIMGSDRHCVETQLNNPKNAKLLKDFIQHCMLYKVVLETPEEQADRLLSMMRHPGR